MKLKQRKPPKVGQTVYSLNIGNAARGREQKLTPMTVTKVGTKYFYLGSGWYEIAFRNEDWVQKTNYSADHLLYESESEYADEIEAERIISKLLSLFDFRGKTGKIPLNSLRQIEQIISPHI